VCGVDRQICITLSIQSGGKHICKERFTITVDEQVYEELNRVVGPANISQFITSLIRPHLISVEMDSAYRQMAEDESRESEASEWTVEDHREHLLKLAGAILIQLQCLEHLIKLCCGCLGVKSNHQRFTYMDLLSPHRETRNLTLGWFRKALKNCKDVSGSQIFAPAFEARLDQLVENRNTFVHEFWVQHFSGPSASCPPSLDEMRSMGGFLGALLVEVDDLKAPFHGLLYTIGKALAEAQGVQALEENTVWLWLSKYQQDFLAVRTPSRFDPDPHEM
jgi:predicted CopG family antitoxin